MLFIYFFNSKMLKMNNNIANKIDAKDKKLREMLSQGRYKLDVFQREYRWQYKQLEELINDLTNSFYNSYKPDHDEDNVDSYNQYYMGPVVLCDSNDSLSIVDGQQRLTSFTLLLIYLYHVQKDFKSEKQTDLLPYLFIKKGTKITLVIDVDYRNDVMDFLITNNNNKYAGDTNDESVQNILDRYANIHELLSNDIKTEKVLPVFIQWLLYKIVLVEVRAYSLENAYVVFETMNDRGLNLSPTDMLKGYLLSKVENEKQASELNDLWKDRIARLRREISVDSDLEFFRAWLRAKYADSIRKAAPNSPNEDFEKIGTQFHAWVRDNGSKKISLNKADDYYFFVQSDFEYFSNLFSKIYSYRNYLNENFETLYINRFFTIADSLTYPLYLAPISKLDDEKTAEEKIKIVDRFLDIYTNIRSIANKTLTQSSIRNYIYELVKSVRNIEISILKEKLKFELDKLFEIIEQHPFSTLHELNNYGYYHYFFSRIIYYLAYGEIEDFATLLRNKRQKSFVLVRIFSEEDIKEDIDTTLKQMYINSVAGHCLVRRNDFENFIDLPPKLRIDYLISQNYLPDLYGYEWSDDFMVSEFILIRDERLRELTDEVWEINLEVELDININAD